MVQQFGEMPIHATDWARDHVEVSAARTFESYAAPRRRPAPRGGLATDAPSCPTAPSPPVPLDLGDRAVELVHPGRAHTAGDLVARVQDVDVLVAGDLVEESEMPVLGEDSWPMEWPLTLDLGLG